MFEPDQRFVKICGITTVDDALLAAGLGADAVGLIFAASSRRVTAGQARDIVRRLPPGIISVGVFRNERRERVVEIADQLGLRAVQLHGHESGDDTAWVAERVPNVFKAFAAGDPALGRFDDYRPARALIDSPEPGSGKPFDWHRLAADRPSFPFVLAGGLRPGNVAEAIELLQPWGVDVASGVEARPGVKDPVALRTFIQAARATPLVAPAAPDPTSAASSEGESPAW